jgi:hypothetical protein
MKEAEDLAGGQAYFFRPIQCSLLRELFGREGRPGTGEEKHTKLINV